MAIDLDRNSTTEKGYSDSLYEVRFVPLMKRAEYESGPVRDALEALQKLMDEKDFNIYINQLLRVNFDGQRLMLVTKKEMHRTMLEGYFRNMICEAFGVVNMRVVSQA